MNATHQLVLMDSSRVERTIRRMAFQLLEDIPDPSKLLLAGLNIRGYKLAQQLQQHLAKSLQCPVQLERIDANSAEAPVVNFDVDNKDIILVDDVLFSGLTMARALNAVVYKADPQRIRIAVLVDRGHRKFPLYPEVYGIKYPTKFDEHVEVITTAKDDSISVILLEGE